MCRPCCLAIAALAFACGPASPSGGPRSAVLITLDTTTPGALDSYAKDRGLTPALARFAQECIVYDSVWSVAPLTLPAHASMLTGLYPPRHTVRDNGHLPLPESADTVAERARAAGLRTAAFVAAAVLAPQYGIAQGFETYEAPVGKTGDAGGILELRGTEVTAAAVRWLDGRAPGEPFFLWVHYFDPHAPYEPPDRHLERAGGHAYRGEVSAMDEAVGDLLARLAVEPDWDRTTVVVVADHGESHGRHGEQSHGMLAYDATLRVPLFVRRPGSADGGTRSDAVASVVDVAPTLLEAMGLGAPEAIDGASLLDGGRAGRGVYIETYTCFLNFGWSPLAGWVDGESKYLHGTRPELFDLRVDADELEDLFREGDPRVTRARRAIADLTARPVLVRTEAERMLAAGSDAIGELGYGASASPVTAIPAPLEPPPGRPMPGERMVEWYAVNNALAIGNTGRLDEAIEALEKVVAENPRNAMAVRTLSRFLVDADRPQRALVSLEGLLAEGLDAPMVRQRFAEALAALGRFDEALAHLERAEELRPGDPDTAELRSRCQALRDASLSPRGESGEDGH